MEEQVKALVDKVLGADSVEASVEMYLEAPKPLRRAAYNLIREKNAEVGKKIRAAAEAKRGIAFRTLDGDLVMSREALTEQFKRINDKEAEMDVRKAALGEKKVALLEQAEKFYGEEFAAELTASVTNEA